MTDDELEALLDALEAEFRTEVQRALSGVSAEFSEEVESSTELVAAAFSVSRIGAMWRRHIPALVSSLRRLTYRGSRAAAEDLGEPVPSENAVDEALGEYFTEVRVQLSGVGDRLSEAAVATLREGLAAGDTQEQLQRRLTETFGPGGAQLGPVRAERIAMTQSTAAFNAGALAAARSLTGPERPLVKQWVTRHDERVRQAHSDADGQLRLLDDPFTVGGELMQFPGDPRASAELLINCRCILRTATAPTERDDVSEDQTASSGTFQSRMPGPLKQYWISGEGAAKIRWGTPGAFDRCVRNLRDDFPQDTQGLCANLYHEATGKWPGQNAAGHTGAMIALALHPEDAQRLAVPDGEPEHELHTTLAFLGEAGDWSPEDRAGVIGKVREAARYLNPVHARAFGTGYWNPAGDDPAWVYSVGDSPEDAMADDAGLYDVRSAVLSNLMAYDRQMPRQHSPWVAHVTGGYGHDGYSAAMLERLGPVRYTHVRVAFGDDVTHIPLGSAGEEDRMHDASPTVGWHTPEPYALAYENQQTGDSRIFAPGALYWSGDGPWPLMYADELGEGHNGARLAGAIKALRMEDGRLTGSGVLYLSQDAGDEAARLLSEDAPLGVSVDLDDVDIEMVDGSGNASPASLLRASVALLDDGKYLITGQTGNDLHAAADSPAWLLESRNVSFTVAADGSVAEGLGPVLGLRAAAGDPDVDGTVLAEQAAGDYLMRITRGRVRGATLVNIPAFAGARIVLEPGDATAYPAYEPEAVSAAIRSTTDYDRVLRHVRASKVPVGAARVAQMLKMPVVAAQRLLAQAASRGEVVRLTRGLYTDSTTSAKADHVMYDDLVASVTGAVNLPVSPRDTPWDGDAATRRVFEWADGDTSKIGRAFAWRDDNADPTTQAAYKLGYADVIDGELTIVPRGVSAAIAAVNGARGGVDLPADERDDVAARLEAVRAHVSEETGDETMNDMQASAWTAMRDLPPMPAAWFSEPTAEELPPGGPGVNYRDGRIFGWVAQAGEPHAGFAKKITIDTLGRIDTSHFLRQRFTLDDGSVVKAGAYTMNVGHHRDGAECETSSCQFDDTRTVAGIVTVGMNERGMWFSGAAAPWLSEWDRRVFEATAPSYHMKKAPGGGWQLRAVLGVPVPGHSSPLLASAVVERAQLALTAAATMAEVSEVIETEQALESAVQATPAVPELDYDKLADAIVAAGARAEERKVREAAELKELLDLAASLDVT